MARPTNADILAREQVLEEGTEAAVLAAQAVYPTATIIEAELNDDGTAMVLLGWAEADGVVRILDLTVNPDGVIVHTDERPNVAIKPDKPHHVKPLPARKPHVKKAKKHK